MERGRLFKLVAQAGVRNMSFDARRLRRADYRGGWLFWMQAEHFRAHLSGGHTTTSANEQTTTIELRYGTAAMRIPLIQSDPNDHAPT
jgi:hypothetical protein